jgi:phosphatidylinositol glycan class N
LYLWLQVERALYNERSLLGDELNYLGEDVLSDTQQAQNNNIRRTRSSSRSRRREQSNDSALSSNPTHFRKHRSLSAADIRVAALFLFYINVAFFGTGNIASIASFQLSSIYRLTTAFNPFLMAVLLVVKILIPFVLLSAVIYHL